MMYLKAAKARTALRDAEMALKQAEGLLDVKGGIGISLALVSRISCVRRQLEAAKTALENIHSTNVGPPARRAGGSNNGPERDNP
jgi:hypothetical protein